MLIDQGKKRIINIIEYTLKQKWIWARHIARMKNSRWTKRCTEWQPKRGRSLRERLARRWQDNSAEEGTTWNRISVDRRYGSH